MMTVSQLSNKGEVHPHVVRYYSRIGLLNPRRHPGNGYKLFSSSDLTRLSFIRQAKSLGFTLDEINQILETSARQHSPCRQVREILSTRIRENNEKIQELLQLQARMEQALSEWKQMADRIPVGDSICHLVESVDAA